MAHGPIWREYDGADEPWYGFETVRDLPGVASDILLVPLFGHCRSHRRSCAHSDGWVLHAGDVLTEELLDRPANGARPL